eukprot:scaffold15899_cov40-Phaeocystis_antarctica.AAC.1
MSCVRPLRNLALTWSGLGLRLGLGEALEERGAHRGLLRLGTSSGPARLAVGHRAPIGRHALAVC